jgi:hypothetical protein
MRCQTIERNQDPREPLFGVPLGCENNLGMGISGSGVGGMDGRGVKYDKRGR